MPRTHENQEKSKRGFVAMDKEQHEIASKDGHTSAGKGKRRRSSRGHKRTTSIEH